MTPALRHPRPGCALTDSPDWGGARRSGDLYPAGRVCAKDGCGARLRRGNPGPLCGPCQLEEAARHKAANGGASASAHGEAVTNAAPVPRHEQEAKMPSAGKPGDTRAKVLALCRERGRITVRQVVDTLALADAGARYHLSSLETAGLIERASDPAGQATEWRPSWRFPASQFRGRKTRI